MQRTTLASAVVMLSLVVASCAAGASAEATGATPGSEGRAPAGTLIGELGVDPIEGGCPYIRGPDGTRYEIIWPGGWQVDAASGELLNPNGEVVAEAGDPITVQGEIADEMVSICQIGPIFRATEVEIPDG